MLLNETRQDPAPELEARPKISEIRLTLKDILNSEDWESTQEQLEKIFFDNVAFSAHIPSQTLKLLNLPESTPVTPDLVKKLCSDPRVIKLVNIHGWNASRQIWQLKGSGKKSWTDAQSDVCLDKSFPVIIINPDSNGWGETCLSESGKLALKKGPKGKTILTSLINLRSHLSSEDDAVRNRAEATSQKLQAELADLPDVNYLSMGEEITDQFQKETMPGSIYFGARAMKLLIDNLGVRGKLGLFGHSQGGRIVTELLNSTDYKRKLEVYAIDVAAAHTGRRLKESFKLFFEFLNFMQSKYGRVLSTVDRAMRMGITSRFGNMLTRMIALRRLQPEIAKQLANIHGSQITSDTMSTLVSQAFAWQFPDLKEVCSPEQIHIRGQHDVLTPNDAFAEWLNCTVAGFGKPDRQIDESIFTDPALHMMTLPGPHYFHLSHDGQDHVMATFSQLVEKMSHIPPNLDERLSSTVMDNQEISISLCVVADEKQGQLSLEDRFDLAIAKSLETSKTGCKLVIPVPVTQVELAAFYPNLVRTILATGFRGVNNYMNNGSAEQSQGITALAKLKQTLDNHFFVSNEPGFDGLRIGLEKYQIKNWMRLVLKFPYQLFMTDSEDKIDQLQNDVFMEEYITEKERIFEHEFSRWAHRVLYPEFIVQYHAETCLNDTVLAAKTYFSEQIRLMSQNKTLLVSTTPFSPRQVLAN